MPPWRSVIAYFMGLIACSLELVDPAEFLVESIRDLTAQRVVPVRDEGRDGRLHRVVAERPAQLMLAGVLLDIVEVMSERLFTQILPDLVHRALRVAGELLGVDEQHLVAM